MIDEIRPSATLVTDALPTQIAQQLRARLINGTLAPGSKLNERILCDELGISRTPLREAIRKLAAEGLLVLEPRRGAFVPSLNPDTIRETFDVIAVLEGLAAQLAATHIDTQGIQALEVLQTRMEAAFEAQNLSDYYEANAAVHDLLSKYANNPVLRETWRQLNDRVHVMRYQSNQDRQKWARALAEHREMITALRDRDADGLREMLEAHIRQKRDALLEQIRQRERSVLS